MPLNYLNVDGKAMYLDKACPRCTGSENPVASGTIVVMGIQERCPDCEGRARVPTENGQAILDFHKLYSQPPQKWPNDPEDAPDQVASNA